MGRVGAVNHDNLQAKADKSVAPGKLKQPDAMPDIPSGKYTTGSDFADDGMVCDGKSDASCFLETGQRARLVQLFQERVLAAQLNYVSALEELRVDALLEQDADLSWVVELVFNVVFIGAGTALSKALTAFRDTKMIEKALTSAEIKATGAQGALRKSLHGELNNITGKGPESMATELAKTFHGLDDSTIGLVVKQAVDTGKTQAHTAAKSAHNADESTDKQNKLDYVSFLKDQSATVFEGVREMTPGRLHDDGLLAMFQAYAGIYHTTSIYKKLLSDQIETFKKSFITRIGYSKPKDAKHAGFGSLSDHPDKTVVKLAWVVVSDGPNTIPKPKLMYRTFQIGWGKNADHYAQTTGVDYHEVEHALTDVAIARHTQVWGAPPEVVVLNGNLQPKFNKKEEPPPMPPEKMTGMDKMRAVEKEHERDLPKNIEGQ